MGLLTKRWNADSGKSKAGDIFSFALQLATLPFLAYVVTKAAYDFRGTLPYGLHSTWITLSWMSLTLLPMWLYLEFKEKFGGGKDASASPVDGENSSSENR